MTQFPRRVDVWSAVDRGVEALSAVGKGGVLTGGSGILGGRDGGVVDAASGGVV